MATPSNKIPVDWSIKDLDHNVLIQPQFPIEDVSIPVGGVLAEQSRFGFQDPITHWTRGKATIITFTTMLYARHDNEGLDTWFWLEDFKALALPDDALGRPPICLFTYGTTISETVIVESVDPVINQVTTLGDPKQVTLNFTLRRYVPFSQKQIDPTKPVKESFFLVASAAEQSYEAIARRYYGDPMLGDRLRKRHPDYPLAPQVGNVVKVPAKGVILGEVVEPASHILSLTDQDAVSAYETVLEERSSRKLVVVT